MFFSNSNFFLIIIKKDPRGTPGTLASYMINWLEIHEFVSYLFFHLKLTITSFLIISWIFLLYRKIFIYRRFWGRVPVKQYITTHPLNKIWGGGEGKNLTLNFSVNLLNLPNKLNQSKKTFFYNIDIHPIFNDFLYLTPKGHQINEIKNLRSNH